MTTLTAPGRLPPAVSVSEDERACLLEVARLALAAAVGAPEVLAPAGAAAAGPGVADRLRTGPTAGRCGAAFVTLLEDGELRGCIGTLDASRPLAECVAMSTVGAARRDPRFREVTADELPAIEIEISVLGPFVVLEDPLSFRVGIDGLLVERGYDRGLLLPQVATEHGLDAPQMLEATCRKAGLPASAWQDPRTRVSAFRTERFGCPAVERASEV